MPSLAKSGWLASEFLTTGPGGLSLLRPEQFLGLQANEQLKSPDRLMQVMPNLLSNAAKFVPVPGGRVVVSLASDVSGLTVCVQDNGPGVPKEQQGLVFERFRQGGDGLNRPQGTGLGLPISRQIVEHFGGRLWLEPGTGQGACFVFQLPWAAPSSNKVNPQQGDKT